MTRSRNFKFAAIVVLAAALVVAAFARVVVVNQYATQTPVESYPEGTWVTYDGAYAGVASEDTDGLSIRVDSASLVSPRQFIDSYASSQVNLAENVIGKYADITPATANTPSVLAVKISLRRSSTNVDGQFSAIDWLIIILQSPSLSLQPDWDLWELADTHMIDQSAFSIQEGSEYATVVPFSIQSQGEYFDPSPLRTRLPLEQGDYEFVVTNSPVRKLITFATH